MNIYRKCGKLSRIYILVLLFIHIPQLLLHFSLNSNITLYNKRRNVGARKNILFC